MPTLNAWRDSAMTWPNLTVKINLFPWSWRLLPRGWYDYSPGGWHRDGHPQAGWWSVTGQWLMFEVDFGLNLPPFTWERGTRTDPDGDPMSNPFLSPRDKLAAIEQAIYDVAVDHPMWIGDDGQPLNYLPERETQIGDFVREAGQAALAAALATPPRMKPAPDVSGQPHPAPPCRLVLLPVLGGKAVSPPDLM